MTVIGELAAFVAGAKASALPAAEQHRLRLHLTDTVVAAVAGAHIADGSALRDFGAEGSLAGRIGCRAATARLTEIDDIHLPSCVTPSAGTVPVALVLAGQENRFDPDAVASAIWAGTEIAARIGVAVDGPKILYRGIWPTYLAAPVAAAATAARIFAMDEGRTGHALSLAFMLMAGGAGRIHGTPSGRWFLYANAVAAGVAAALAARAGYRGDPDLLEKEWLAETHGIALDRRSLASLPDAASVYAALSMKPYCSAKQAIAAVEAFRAILATPLRPADISRVRVRVPPAYAGMIATRAEPGARITTLVSVAHQIALAALAPDRLYDIARDVPDIDAALIAFAAKVEVAGDPALEALYPGHWPAEVEVEADSQVFRQRMVEAKGDPEKPLAAAEIDDKAHHVLGPLLGTASAANWLRLCHDGLTDSAGCKRLAAALAEAA